MGRGALICGAGPIGLIALAAARASGAHPIVITDLEPKRLAFAKEFVPSCVTYQVNRELNAEQNAAEIRKLYGADKDEYAAPPTVLECTGVESSVCIAAYTVRRGGVVCVIGVGKSIMNNLPFMHISLAEVSVIWFMIVVPKTWLTPSSRLTCGSSIATGIPGPPALPAWRARFST